MRSQSAAWRPANCWGSQSLSVRAQPTKWAEVTVAIASQHQGHGFGRETAQVLIDWGFRKVRLARVIGLVLPENAASMRFTRELGFRDLGEREVEDRGGTPRPSIEFELSREDWMRRIRASHPSEAAE